MAITRNGQWELAGLLIGEGTSYPVASSSGLGTPAVRPSEITLSDRDGSWSGRERLENREIILELGVDGDPDASTYGALIDALALAWKPSDDDVVLRWRRFGRIRRANVRPRGLVVNWDDDFHLGAAHVSGRLVGLDPIVYNDAETVVSGTGAVTVTNAGNYPTWGTVAVTGPTALVTLLNVTDGNRQISLVDLAADASLDLKTRSVTSAGQAVPQRVAPGSLWWRLVPGANNLTLSGAAGFTVTFRSGWTTG